MLTSAVSEASKMFETWKFEYILYYIAVDIDVDIWPSEIYYKLHL